MAIKYLTRKGFNIFLISIIIFSAGVSCKGNLSPDENQPVLPASTPTIIPTQAPDRAILAASSTINAGEIAEAQAVIAALAAQAGLAFETRETIFSNEMTPDVKIIVFLEQPDNLGSLAASAPETQFVAISSQEWNPPANGSIIRINNDHAAFLAGYLSAILAPNFRVGALQVDETVPFNQAFVNGVSYYCGICASIVLPYHSYPAVAQLPAGSSAINWQTAFNELNTAKVNVLFLPREAATPELGSYLASQDVAVIGNAPPPEELRAKWVATITSDGLTALQEIWADVLAGNGGKTINASLKFSDVNYVTVADGLVWLSEGKMQQVNELIRLLRDGQIYPYSVIQ